MEGEIPAAGFFLSRRSGRAERFLLVQNRRRREWGFPKGHARPGEDLRRCALRECAEETGIGLVTPRGGPWDLAYALPDGRPKRVRYWAAETAQEDVVLSKEHRAAAWLTAEEVLERLPFPTLARLFRRHLAERGAPC